MRPHRLRLSAFGAFGQTAVVDFDALAGGGLFLLHGDTGAGKTTLLDAIGYALYGRVPGTRGQVKRLRSDHASAGTRSEVELEATVAGRRLRITRSPEQVRAKRRGSGTTQEPARVLVQELVGGRWNTVSTRAGEADAELSELLGMSAEQFFQVVLLPQGEFARFLRADAAERGRLLERLFGTDRFRAVEHRLADLRRATQAELGRHGEAIAGVAARVCQVAGVPEPESPLDESWLAALTSTAAADHERAERARLDAEHAYAAAERGARAAADLADRQRRRHDALQRQTELTQESSSMAELQAEADAAERAVSVAMAVDAVTRVERTLTAATAAKEAICHEVVQAGGPPPGSTAEDYRAAAQDQRQRLGRLQALQGTATQAEQEQKRASAARHRAEQLTAELESFAEQLRATASLRQQLLHDRGLAVAAGADLPAARTADAQARVTADDATTLAQVEQEQQPLADGLVLLRERAVQLRERASDLRSARIDGMVAELASHLEPGTPCPVCGSPEHPDPTEQTLPAARVTREAEKAAYREFELADEERGRQAERLSALNARRGDLRARLLAAGVEADRQVDPARLHQEAVDAEVLAERLSLAAAALPRIDTDLAEHEGRTRGLAEGQAASAEQRAAAQNEAQSAVARAVELQRIVRVELGVAPSLATAVRTAGSMSDLCTQAAGAVEAADRSRTDSDSARAEVTRLACEAGFATAAAAVEAVRVPAWRAQARERLTAHRDALTCVNAVLTDASLRDLPGAPPDVTAARAALEAARSTWQAAVAAAGGAARTVRELAVLAARLRTALTELVPVAERAAEVRGLADLAAGGGGNVLRMTLSSYVLAARLEEVAAGASERLLRMTQGRYSLVHTDAGRGNARAGLGLLARDTWTGVDRDTSTLSGGETFLASLALALGLADAVAAEAGGARLEALFVDEGFGSLDDETLDEVMDVLDGLREGGRLVGIVSHVAELRQRIPTQLHVRKGRDGSAISAISAVSAVGEAA